jgi:hypothetical protein
MSRRGRGYQGSVWRVPIALALISATGLVAGLLGDGAWDFASWVGLGLPVAACVWYGLLHRPKR